MGLTETAARARRRRVREGRRSRGRRPAARWLGRDEGITKLLFEPGGGRLLGAGIVGVNAGDLIAETVHALEMGADAEDIGADDPPPPHAVGDDRVRGGDGRRHDHRPAAAAPASDLSSAYARQRY